MRLVLCFWGICALGYLFMWITDLSRAGAFRAPLVALKRKWNMTQNIPQPTKQIEVREHISTLLTQVIGELAPQFPNPQALPELTRDRIREAGACEDGRRRLTTGAKNRLGVELTGTMLLTPEFIIRTGADYSWPVAAFSDWRVGNAQRMGYRAALILATAAARHKGWEGYYSALLSQVTTELAKEHPRASGFTERASQMYSGTTSSGYKDQVARALCDHGNNGVPWLVSFARNIFDLSEASASEVVARALEAAQGKVSGDVRAYATPLKPGQIVSVGELRFEVKIVDGVPVFEKEVYRFPEGGEKWLSGTVEYLILQGAGQAVNLKSGQIVALDAEKQLPNTVRGVSFTFKAKSA